MMVGRTDRQISVKTREGGRQAAEGKQRIREAVMLLDRKEDAGNGEKMETNDAGSRSGLIGTP